MIEIDASAFDDYAGDLLAAVDLVASELPEVVGHGALNVKNDWNKAFWASAHFRGVGGTVSYETRTTRQFVEAEVGPDKERYPGLPGPPRAPRAAGLAVIAHFGGANGGGGTVADPQTFLDTEEPKFVAALNALIGKALP